MISRYLGDQESYSQISKVPGPDPRHIPTPMPTPELYVYDGCGSEKKNWKFSTRINEQIT